MVIWKIVLIGLLTTIVRIIAQLLIPAGSQAVLMPSVFAQNGTMPVAFTLYGIVAYSIIALLFLQVREGIGGKRIARGLKYAVSCCLIWSIYLLEPLPHVALLDKFTYPVADSVALLVMGALSGLLLCEKKEHIIENKSSIGIVSTMIIAGFFVIGRLFQYRVFNIYSSFSDQKTETLIWAASAGLIVGIVLQWLESKMSVKNRYTRVVILGFVLFGVDLLLFNFFMPIVFDADIPDLIIRTCIDVISVTVGCFAKSRANGN